MDGTAVGDGKADALENGSVPEDKLAEEAEEGELSSPFSVPGDKCVLGPTHTHTQKHTHKSTHTKAHTHTHTHTQRHPH